MQAFAALSALLARVAGERPLILVMDDLQWADAESFRLLRAIIEDPRTRPPVLVLKRQSTVFNQAFAARLLAQVAALEGTTERALSYAQAAGQGFAKLEYVGAHAASYLAGLLDGSSAG